MGNQDKIFNQIKAAAEKAEAKDFPAMENVWSRVEGKLDKKVLTKENTLWKKIAVAASVLLVVSILYQYFKNEEKVLVPKNDIVVIDTTKAITPQRNESAALPEITSPAIKENAEQILQKQIAAPSQIVINNSYTITSEDKKGYLISDSLVINEVGESSAKSNASMPTRVFPARGVVYADVKETSEAKKTKQEEPKKLDPLIVIDNGTEIQQRSKIDDEDIETLTVLPDPLYIINGVYYTEKELFGPNPTSPYAPLSKLKIETISILQDEKATAIYGEIGKKGVVIITTKNGKPTFK